MRQDTQLYQFQSGEIKLLRNENLHPYWDDLSLTYMNAYTRYKVLYMSRKKCGYNVIFYFHILYNIIYMHDCVCEHGHGFGERRGRDLLRVFRSSKFTC